MDTQKLKITPKDFFLWAGAMVSLYSGVIAFIGLLFSYIDYVFHDPLKYYVNPYSGGMPYQMASLIILGPVFLILMRVIRRSIQRDPSRAEIWVRRWALYLTVFAAGGAIAVDLIVLLTSFLAGDAITTAFFLKFLVVLLVATGGFLHFISDVRGYWGRHPRRVNAVNYATGATVILVIIAGFFIVGTPRDARLIRYDEQKVTDLQNIQYQILNYWQSKGALPDDLDQLKDPLTGYTIPTDEQSGATYTYKKTGDLAFSLCATFNKDSLETSTNSRAIPLGYDAMNANWEHKAGDICFDREIDPELYPVREPNGKI